MPKVAPPPWPSRPMQVVKSENTITPDDPRYPIFKQLYMVRIPAAQLRTIEDLRQFGVVQTGMEQYDRQMATEERVVMLPISRLVELYNEGAKIAVVNDVDTRKIYEAISTYLYMWKERISGSLNRVKIPAQDLIDLDNFAHAVYERAKWNFEADFISQHMSVIRRSGARGILSALKIREEKPVERKIQGITFRQTPKQREALPQVELDDNPQQEEDNFPRRESLADFFRPPKTTGNLTIHGTNKVEDIAPAQRTTSTNPSVERLLGNRKGKGS